MSRVKRSISARKKRRKVLEQAKGYRATKTSSYKRAKEQVQRSGQYAYRDRRNRRRDLRRRVDGERLVESLVVAS